MCESKSIQFRHTASEELSYLFEDFRLMCNNAIRIALKKSKNRFKLVELAYPRLKEYGLHTHYILSAMSRRVDRTKNSWRSLWTSGSFCYVLTPPFYTVR